MEKNQFGKVSRLILQAKRRGEKTVLTDVQFTAPYKIMKPFPRPKGGICVMQLAASAGIMEGDRQEIRLLAGPGADLEVVSQAYDKIHQMREGCARRRTEVQVSSGARLYLNPQPVIPFGDSAFESRTEADLADESAVFWMSEIFSCGRLAMGERFAYRSFHSLTRIRRAGCLIYRDNTRYEPALMDMEGVGMYESYTHLLSIFASRPENPEEFFRQTRRRLDDSPKTEGGVTRLAHGDFAVRVFGKRAQVLERVSEGIKEIYQNS